MTTDWVNWHRDYDDPNSSLARRLGVVRRDLRRALDEAPVGSDGVLRLVSICAGDGRDVLPVLADHRGTPKVQALLVELDPTLADRARATARDRDLAMVEVCTTDAGVTDPYLKIAPAHIALVCGVFGNITLDHARTTIATLPSLLASGGIVIWTRGRDDNGTDPSSTIRSYFTALGFSELLSRLWPPGLVPAEVGQV